MVLSVVKDSVVHVLYDDGEEEEVDLSDEQFVLGNPADKNAVASVSAALSEASLDGSFSQSVVDTLREKGIDPVKALTGTLSTTDNDSSTFDSRFPHDEEEDSDDGSDEEDSDDSDDSEEDSEEESVETSRRRRRARKHKTPEEIPRVTVKFVLGTAIRRRELPINQVRPFQLSLRCIAFLRQSGEHPSTELYRVGSRIGGGVWWTIPAGVH